MGVDRGSEVAGTATGVSISPWTLVFSRDPALEQGFRQHQRKMWAAYDLRNVYLNLAAAVINFTITACQLQLFQGCVFTLRNAQVVLPYMVVAIVHWLLAARWQQWPRYRAVCNLLLEVSYSAVCTLSMPTWVLHGHAIDLKGFVRTFILGSGILIGYWCRFLTPTFFCVAQWLVPLQFTFQAWHLTGPTCATVEAEPYGALAARKLSNLLDLFAGATMESCPAHSCHNLQYMLQLLTGGTLLYVHYRMEHANRLAYLQSRGLQGASYWPFVPVVIGVVLHVAVYAQVLAAAWVFLQCRAAAAAAAS